MSNSPKVERKLAAIMFTDIVNYSKIMNKSEKNALEILDIHDELLNEAILQFDGNLIKKMGDGNLIEFKSTLDAVKCAINLQQKIKNNKNNFHIRIGIHIGDIIIKDNDIFGDGINVASRIINFADSGEICLSKEASITLKGQNEILTASIGTHELKNIAGKWDLHRVFINQEDFKKWSEKNYLDNKYNKGENKQLKKLIKICGYIVVFFICFNFFTNQYIKYANKKNISNLEVLVKDLHRYAFDELDNDLIIKNNQLTIAINLHYLFSSGSTDLMKDEHHKYGGPTKYISSMVNIINEFNGSTEIRVHSDNIEIPKGWHKKFGAKSNNEYTAKRAASLFDSMIENGLNLHGNKFKFTFWGSTIPFGFDPIYNIPTKEEIVENNETMEMQAKNRRIEFVFTSDISLYDAVKIEN
tara:strand:- start:165 stop:1406 length:1242 start_codon:yes stop_codon:yes gene_type:complete